MHHYLVNTLKEFARKGYRRFQLKLNFLNTVAFLLLCVSAALIVTGCDEGMNMMDPIIKDPITDPGGKDTGNTGEMKQPGEDDDPGSGESNPGETKTPTITIGTVAQADDGSVTVSGTSTELAAGETVTITLGGTVTVTTTTDATGAWSVAVPATEAATLAAGATAVTAAAGTATGTSSFERTVPEEVPSHGIIVSTEEEQIMLDITIDVWGYDDTEKGRRLLKYQYDFFNSQYGAVFEVGAEISAAAAAFRRFVEYENKKSVLAVSGNFNSVDLNQYFEEAYGFSAEFSESLVHDIYLEEIPEDKKFLSTGWQAFDIGMEYLLLQLANPDASPEELEELLRESIRAGKVSIAST